MRTSWIAPRIWVNENLTEFHPRYNNEQTNLLVFTLEGHTCKTTIKLKIADDKKLLELFESTTKLARTGSAQGTESGALNRRSMPGILCILLWLLFYESKMDQN